MGGSTLGRRPQRVPERQSPRYLVILRSSMAWARTEYTYTVTVPVDLRLGLRYGPGQYLPQHRIPAVGTSTWQYAGGWLRSRGASAVVAEDWIVAFLQPPGMISFSSPSFRSTTSSALSLPLPLPLPLSSSASLLEHLCFLGLSLSLSLFFWLLLLLVLLLLLLRLIIPWHPP